MIEAGILAGRAVELLHGEIVDMPPEGEPHACYSSLGAEYLRGLLTNLAVIREAKPITLPNQDSEPQPDLAIVQPPLGRYLDHHPTVAEIFWVVEYSQATLSKDLGEKKATYAAAGIPEYWVVNLQERKLHVFRQPNGQTYQTETTNRDGVVVPLAFPAISVDLQRLYSV
jgi:Uma2 family endonuclease